MPLIWEVAPAADSAVRVSETHSIQGKKRLHREGKPFFLTFLRFPYHISIVFRKFALRK